MAAHAGENARKTGTKQSRHGIIFSTTAGLFNFINLIMEVEMAARAGENAPETGDFYCENCAKRIHVTKEDVIPCCPICGHNSYGKDPKDINTAGSD